MKHIYTIKGDEMVVIKVQLKGCSCGETKGEVVYIPIDILMGRVFPHDKGKRVYMREIDHGFGIERTFQVENDEQRDKRMGVLK